MKRSEMIGILERHFNGAGVKSNYNGGNKSFADDILQVIERCGMLPPKSLDSTCLKKGLVRGYTIMFEWEDEDE